MRRSVEEARAELARLDESERTNAPPETRGRQAEDLRGRVVGTSTVVGFLAHDEVSPWWIVRCSVCCEWDVARGSSIRGGSSKVCPGCNPARARRAQPRHLRLRLDRDAAGALLAVVETEIDRLEHGLTEGEDFTSLDADVEREHADYVEEKRQDTERLRACAKALRAAFAGASS